jgi:hypothetical protein
MMTIKRRRVRLHEMSLLRLDGMVTTALLELVAVPPAVVCEIGSSLSYFVRVSLALN